MGGLAFAGVVLLFAEGLTLEHGGFWRGDSMIIGGAVSWALLTLWTKRFLTVK